jgi:alpha-tubulin suppressor-like RCC1 family protein
MSTNFKTDDITRGSQLTDLDDRYVTESWLIDRFTQGTLFAWGNNNWGGLGVGDTISRSSPIQVGIKPGYDSSIENGYLTYEWYTHTATVHPTTTTGLNAFFTTATSGVTFGGSGVYGDIINWGDSGQTGILGVVGAKPPYLPADSYSWRVFGFIKAPETGIYTFSVDGDDACDIIVDGQVIAFWYNGHGFSSQVPRPATAVGTISLTAGQIYSFEVRFEEISGGDGIVAAWQPPSGSSIVAIPPSVFVRGNLAEWSLVAAGEDYSLAIKQDGTLWAWGDNRSGCLGLGDIVHRSTPVQVGSLNSWSNISAGLSGSLAIDKLGNLWAWGENSRGGLGLGDITHRSSPVQVGSKSYWKSISTNNNASAAITTEGSLWVWGNNSGGRLGLGDTTHRSSPTQVGSLTNWKSVDMGFNAIAIKNDGTLWTWGSNFFGALGLGDALDRSSPNQIASHTDWKQATGSEATCAAIKQNGSLWIWGNNTTGQLGLGDRIHRSTPIQLGNLTNWKQIDVGLQLCTAVKTDGTLWSWGSNTFGALGLGDIIHRSSPVQIGSNTNWKRISVTVYHTLALTYKEEL